MRADSVMPEGKDIFVLLNKLLLPHSDPDNYLGQGF